MVRALWSYFSDDYPSAARRFLQGVERLHESGLEAELEALPIAPRGPRGELLAIHGAWVGPHNAPRVLIHSSGLHGPEAFAGCAIQLALLEDLAEKRIALPEGTALALLHVVNPYGMAWRRRTNENNVDLNRNFLPEGQEYRGADPLYGELDSFMNPKTPEPSGLAFKAGMLRNLLRHGKPAIMQAFAGGQFEFPKGIMFGGRALEESPRQLLGWLKPRLANVKAGFMIDVHTGLGPYSVDILLVPDRIGTPRFEALKQTFVRWVQSLDANAGDAYKAYQTQGSMIEGVAARWPGARWTCIGQEFGTYSSLTGLTLLRAENAWTHWGDSAGADAWRHKSRAALLDYMRPEAKLWKWRVVRRGEVLVQQGLDWLQRDAGAGATESANP